MKVLSIAVGRSHPLELVLALVRAGAADRECRWAFTFSEAAFHVVTESAFFAISTLMHDGRALVSATVEMGSLVIEADAQLCAIHTDGDAGFEECVRFLRAIGVATGEIERAIALRAERWMAGAERGSNAAILIGTGPSLRDIDLRLYPGALSIGCNKLYLLPYEFRPTHYVFEDRVVTEDVFAERPPLDATTIWLPHDLGHLATTGIRYCLDRVVIDYPSFSTTPDLAYSGWTVMYVMLQIAYWMGVREVFLVGVDGTYHEPSHTSAGVVRTSAGVDHNHFISDYYGPGARYQRPAPERVAAAYDCAQRVYAADGRRIVNCSAQSAINAFERGTLPPPGHFDA